MVSSGAPTLPKTLALVDDDATFAEFMAQYLRDRGVDVHVFGDSNDLLADLDAYGYGFYLIDLTLPGIDGLDLIKVLRRRTDAGVLVVSGRLSPEVFGQVVGAGADMYLAKPVQFDQVAVAIGAIQRRVQASAQSQPAWQLDRRARQLVAPDGARVDLSQIDQVLMECFASAGGEVVSRQTLSEHLAGTTDNQEGGADSLTATIYRLKRRIERATPTIVPLQSKSRIGYVFKAPLVVR